MEKAKREVKIKFNPPISLLTTKEVDYQPFLIRSSEGGEQKEGYFMNPLFISSTSYGAQFPNWGSKPFERVRPIDKAPLKFKFAGDSNYHASYFKAQDRLLPPQHEREHDRD
mmetsp:Transcript_29415/g.21875  ORF Transcript_29415/g.21875 Transcript_29415/m.21875 type:complete len:112 (+) Transcript_29415:674-1009(+)